MSSYVPIIKNGAAGAILYVSLTPRTANGQWQSNPTLATGDVKISLDGGSLNNLGTLPAVTPASSKLVKITLSQAETNADNLTIIFSDAAGAEWCDLTVNLQTAAKQFDDLATQSSVDAIQSDTNDIQTRLPAALVSGRMDSSIGAVASGVIAAASFASGALDAVWSTATRLLTAGTNIVLAKGTGVTGFNDLSAAQINAEVDTALADYDAPTKAELDAAVSPLATAVNLATVDTVVDAIKVTTDKLDDTVEDDGGTFRFTANALEQAPTGGSAPTADEIADEVQTRTIAAVTLVNGLAANSVTAAALAADAGTEIGTAVWATTTRLLTAGTNIALAKGTGVTGFNDLSAAQVNAEADAALADAGVTTTVTGRIDAAITTRLASVGYTAPDNASVTAIKAKTDSLTFTVAGQVDANVESVNEIEVIGTGVSGDEWNPAP